MKMISQAEIESVIQLTLEGGISPIPMDKFAFQKGKAVGEKEGYERALKEFAAFFSLIGSLTDKLLEHKKRLLQQLKPEIIDFAITVCERVIRQELTQPEKLAKMIDSLLSAGVSGLEGDMVTIRLASEDLITIESHLTKINYDKREIKGVRFVPDTSLRRGDFRIETRRGLINCSISRELEDLRSKVLRV